MYKAIQNKKYYLAINTFPSVAKDSRCISDNTVYLNGIRIWDSQDMKTYSLVLGTFRIMFGVKHTQYGDCAG